MILNSPYISGSITVTGNSVFNGSITVTGGISGSSAVSASYAVSSSFASNATSTSFATNALTASYAANVPLTSSFAISASQAQDAVSSSFAAIAANTDLLDGKNSTEFAITGSNTFVGTQHFSDTTNATGFGTSAAIYTDGGLRVSKDTYVSGTMYLNNLVVFGSASVDYVTSSTLVGLEYITLNTDLPSLRYAGINVQDSGSAVGNTASLWYDSENNDWLFVHESSGSTDIQSSMLLFGPLSTNNLGNEVGINGNYLTKGQVVSGESHDHHVTSSQIYDDGTTVRIPGSLQVTGSIYTSALTGSLNGSNLVNASVANAKLTNSTISGISLGSNLATLTIGTGLSGTSYNGSTAVTIANTGVTSNVAGNGISINQGTGAVTITNTGILALSGGTGITVSGPNSNLTITNTITNTNQLTNGAGFITSAGTAAAVLQTVSGTNTAELVRGNMADNDQFRILVGGTSSNAGYVEIATADDGTEPIYVRQYTGTFGSLTRSATLLDGSGNTSFPGTVSASTFSSTSATFTNSITVSSGNTTGNGIILADDGDIVDLNDAFCSMRFSSGVRIFSANRGGSAVIKLGSGGDIVASADITAFGSPSDITLKENIKPLKTSLDKILKIQGVTFDWKEDSETRKYTNLKEDVGFIAQQVQEVVPELVRKNDNGLLSLRDKGITALLVEAIKEQQTQIEELKTIINGLTK